MKTAALLPVALIFALVMGLAMGAGKKDEPAATQQTTVSNASLKPGVVPKEYEGFVTAAGSVCKGINSPLVAAQIETESNWNKNAVSPANAIGLSQFIPATWKSYGADGNGDGKIDPREPADAIKSQAIYMCAIKKQVEGYVKAGKAKGDIIDLTLAGYNAGPGAVLEHGGVPPFAETQAYIPKIKTRAAKYAEAADSSAGAPAPSGPLTPAAGEKANPKNPRKIHDAQMEKYLYAVRAAGCRVYEHPKFGGVTPGVHGSPESGGWHYLGGAADGNCWPGSAQPANAQYRKNNDQAVCMAVAYGIKGVQWQAPGHQNHWHVDVSGYYKVYSLTNYGRSLSCSPSDFTPGQKVTIP